MSPAPRFDPADPLTFPLAFKSWVVQYVAQELLITQLVGYKAVVAPQASQNAYRAVVERSGAAAAQAATTDAVMLRASPSLATLPAGALAAGGTFWVDPADYAVTGLTAYMALRAEITTNAVAPSTSFVVKLYPVTAVAGGAGANSITLGTVTKSVTLTTPALNTMTAADSGDFVFPAAGLYVLTVTWAGNMAASSSVNISASLRARTK